MFWKSKTFWGAVLVCVPKLIESAGVVIPDFIHALIQSVGGILGAYGIRSAIVRTGVRNGG